MIHKLLFVPRFLLAAALLLGVAAGAAAQDEHPGDAGSLESLLRVGSSPFAPPDDDDTTFVVDQGAGLDTGCTFRSGGPLVFEIPIDRVVGDIATLKASGLISAQATLRMPAFDVDFAGGGSTFAPERDRVTFNGHVVPGEFLTGGNGIWKLNTFSVPIEWVEFAADPGAGGTAQPAANTVRIDIDTANSQEVWCTAIDWAVVEFHATRPVVMAHGILSNGSIWDHLWVPRLQQEGILTDNDLNMGALDSIQSNAGKIAAVVERAKQRWGVDRVNLVAHSKGGLDSRHFAEDDDSVDQIVQLGTPNAGSPLADVAQGGLLALGGLAGSAVANALAGPAGYQLTTYYMAGYNLFHGHNPKVQYTALAGDYDPDCFFLDPFCKPLERALLAITGAGDTIVPLTSAHSLGYTINRTYGSSGDDKDATHSGLHGSAGVYGVTSDRLLRYGRSLGPALAAPPEWRRTATAGGTVEPGFTAAHSLPLDEAGPAFFLVLYSGGTVDLALVSPSGQRIDAAAAAADPNVEHGDGEVAGGRAAVIGLADAEPGTWTVEVLGLGADDPAVPVTYTVNGWLEAPAVQLSAAVAPEAIVAGGVLDVFATLHEDGAPLAGATAVARVGLPGGGWRDLALADDGAGPDAVAGDGVYSARFTETGEAGYYKVLFTAAGTGAAGSPFSREELAVATVSASASAFAGGFRDFGRDHDGDGLYDDLVVAVDLDITAPGTYRLFGVLTDTAGNRHESFFYGALPAGPATVELSFDGARIFANRTDGPYTLATARLAEDEDLLLPLGHVLDAHSTAAYSYLQFEHSPIWLGGTATARGLDFNGNGLFDRLDIGLGVGTDVAGFYQWSALLLDRNGREIGFDTGSGFLASGQGTLQLQYAGRAIGTNGVDGPYSVASLLVFGAGGSLVVGTAFETPAFLASQFEGYRSDNLPPALTVRLDPSMLWPPKHQLVPVQAILSVSDDTDPSPAVELVSITSSEVPDGLGDGHTPDDVQDASFGTDDRQFLLRAERSGTGSDRVYTVTYRAIDETGNSTTAAATVVVPHDRR